MISNSKGFKILTYGIMIFLVLCLCCVLPVFRNLDVDSFGFPFLVSALSIFLIANISRN